MISLAGAYNTVSEGYKCVGINPANLTKNNKMSISLLNLNLNGINNFITIDRYNKMNGANLEDPNADKYYDKDKILGFLNEENISYFTTGNMPLPVINFSINNFAIISKINFYSSCRLSPDLFDIVLYGNEIDRLYDLSMYQENMIIWESSFSKAYDLDLLSLGFSLKYHHGFGYYKLEPSQDSLYFSTDISDINAEAEYIMRQNMKGNGFSVDLGILTKEVNGWRFGFSIINIGGNINWNRETILDDPLKDIYSNYPLRENEHYYINLIIDGLNLDVLNSPNISTEDIFIVDGQNVIELNTNPNVSGNLVEGQDYFESTLSNSYFIPSDTISSDYLTTLSNKRFSTDLPTKLNIGFSKKIDQNKKVIFDLSTGFDDSFMNEKKWRCAFGAEFGSEKFPLRVGISYGGYDDKSIGLGCGLNLRGFSLDLGISYKGSMNYIDSNGIDFGLDFYWMKN